MLELLDVFHNNASFVITAHERPDGDCIGSQLSLLKLLERWDKEVHLVNPDPVPTSFDFLVEETTFQTTPPEHQVDVGLVIDCGNLDRTNNLRGYLRELDSLVCLDHHRNNSITADLRAVFPDISSVGEIIFFLYREAGEAITPEVAQALYVSILTDTGCFRHANTSEQTHRVVAELIELGEFEPYRVYSDIYERETLESVVLLGHVLANLKQKNGIVWGEVTRELFEATGTTEEDLKEVINYLRQVNESAVALLFCERDDETVKVSFRAKTSLDLLPVVNKFGGGGHSGAAGASIKGELGEVRDKVINEVEKVLDGQEPN